MSRLGWLFVNGWKRIPNPSRNFRHFCFATERFQNYCCNDLSLINVDLIPQVIDQKKKKEMSIQWEKTVARSENVEKKKILLDGENKCSLHRSKVLKVSSWSYSSIGSRVRECLCLFWCWWGKFFHLRDIA